ncbi:hypothetical protein [Ammoniphilus sp. 3BR4]|uniref:hypothetical protein n=1 Tax=Ammoniphilus sp. 3BR4 TaxID=3158265 RepID=UPI003464F665
MLKICVLVKPIMDPASIQWDFHQQRFAFLSNSFNSADLHALQWACDYKQKHGGTITVLLAADPNWDIDQARLLKYPIDECVVLRKPDLQENRDEVAVILANELNQRPFDLILSGSVSEDAHLGITPSKVAELLSIPSLTNIHDMEKMDERKWKVKRSEGRGIVQTYQMMLPALIGVVSSLGRKRYIPRNSPVARLHKKMAERTLGKTTNKPRVKVLKVSDPQPNIRYFSIPSVHLSPVHRMLQIMGLAQGKKEQSGDKVASEINERNIHFISQKIQKWLKEE